MAEVPVMQEQLPAAERLSPTGSWTSACSGKLPARLGLALKRCLKIVEKHY
jgi:hypothetical protein